MPVNLGVILGVSDYEAPTQALPACRQDAALIAAILKEGDKFSSVLELTDNCTAAHVKQRLSEFIDRHSSADIGEFVFYFSGHGYFDGAEFFFILQDYDRGKQAQTSLSNTELDGMIKSLSPRLAVKVVDACQSAVSYVKEPEAFNRHLKSTQDGFKNCYFLFSSHSDQFSYADSTMSRFTREIGIAVRDQKSESIRYKDVMDHVSDAFQNDGNQSPFFVTQANFTEVLNTVSASLRAQVAALLPKTGVVEVAIAQGQQTEHPLLAQVRGASQKFVDREAGLAALEAFCESLQSTPLAEPLPSLFDCKVSLQKDNAFFPSGKALADWLSKRSDNILAKVSYEPRTVSEYEKKPVPDRYSVHGMVSLFEQYEYVKTEKEVQVPAGIVLTAKSPLCGAHIELLPRFSALERWMAFVVICFSRRDFFAFYAMARLRETDWGDYAWPTEVAWKSLTCSMADPGAMRRCAQKIIERLSEDLLKKVETSQGSGTAR